MNAALSKSISVETDAYQYGPKSPQACILRIYTSVHELKCMQENALIIDAVTKHMIGRLQQDRR